MFKITINKQSKREIIIQEIIEKTKELEALSVSDSEVDESGFIISSYKSLDDRVLTDTHTATFVSCNGVFMAKFLLKMLLTAPEHYTEEIFSTYRKIKAEEKFKNN